jgi:hypothetical protein
VALNIERLQPIIEKHDLYPQRENLGRLYAVERLRDALHIQVSSNYFARTRGYGDPVRSAGITIVFTDKDPELAFRVAQDLSTALVDAEQTRRTDIVKKIDGIADSTVKKVEKRLKALNEELAEVMRETQDTKKRTRKQKSTTAAAILRQTYLQQDIKIAEALLAQVTADRNQTRLAVSAEGANQALRFEIIEVLSPLVEPKASMPVYILLGLAVFICLLPIASITIAAMDTRLHHIEDLVRLNLPVVGHMPAFPSHSMGSMRDRGRTAKKRA